MGLSFKLVRKEVPVELEQDGQVFKYTLRELTGADRDKYAQMISDRTKWKGGKMNGLSSVKGLAANLISASLFDEEGKNVPAATILHWPSSVVESLYDAASDLSRLKKEEDEEGDEGND